MKRKSSTITSSNNSSSSSGGGGGGMRSTAPATVTSIVNRKNKVMAASAALSIEMKEAVEIEQKRLEMEAMKRMVELKKMRQELSRRRDELSGSDKGGGIARLHHQRMTQSYNLQIDTIDTQLKALETKSYLTEFFTKHLEYMNVYEAVKNTPKTIAQMVAGMLKIRSDVLVVQSPSEVPISERVYCFKENAACCVACEELTRAHELKLMREAPPSSLSQTVATAGGYPSAKRRKKKKPGLSMAALAAAASAATGSGSASSASIGQLSTAHFFFEHEGERFCKQHCMFKWWRQKSSGDDSKMLLVNVYTYSQRAHLYMEKLDKITVSLSKIVMAALVEDFRASCAGCTWLGASECVKYAYINFVQLHKQHDHGLFQLCLNSSPGDLVDDAAVAQNIQSSEPYSSLSSHSVSPSSSSTSAASAAAAAAAVAVASSVYPETGHAMLCSAFEQVDTCTVCNIPLVLVSAQSVLVCSRCGRSDVFLDCMNIISAYDKENESATQYKRIGHLETQLTCMQAKDTKAIPKEVIVQILYVLCASKKVKLPETVVNFSGTAPESHLNHHDEVERDQQLLLVLQQTLQEQLDKADIRYALKILNLRRYYDNAPRILMMMTGLRPPQMTATQEDRIRQRFRAIQTPVDRHCPPGRSSFVPYFYIIYKICQMEFWPEFLPHCKLPKKLEKRQQTDRIWKIFCEELDGEDPSLPWVFYKTPPPAPPAPSSAYLLQICKHEE